MKLSLQILTRTCNRMETLIISCCWRPLQSARKRSQHGPHRSRGFAASAAQTFPHHQAQHGCKAPHDSVYRTIIITHLSTDRRLCFGSSFVAHMMHHGATAACQCRCQCQAGGSERCRVSSLCCPSLHKRNTDDHTDSWYYSARNIPYGMFA